MNKCSLCDRKQYSSELCYMHYRRTLTDNPRPTAGMSDDERFAFYTSKVADDNGCLVYTAGRRGGYGQFWSEGRNHIASRWAYARKHGPVPADLVVCHTCDNPACVNTEHLFVATNPDNTQDKVEKNRQYMKITPDQVLEIFDDTRSIGEIAEAYGVCHRTIEDLLKGRTRHTKDNPALLDKVAWRKFRKVPRSVVYKPTKLTADDVVAICADERAPSIIAKEYGVSNTWIHKLKARNRQQAL